MNEIMQAVQYHHNLVKSKGYFVVMTSLVGSQNYNLSHENSDIDTYSLILPNWKELIHADDSKGGIIFAEDGHCNFKDIRIALNLLEKTSPNSIEYFASNYIIYNPAFESAIRSYLEDKDKLYSMIHCNYEHMLYAIAGMGHQLTKRNMSAGKRFSHALRLEHILYNFITNNDVHAILKLNSEVDRELALQAKLNTDPINDIFYNKECEKISKKLDQFKENFKLSDKNKITEEKGLHLIEQLRCQIGSIYISEARKWI